MVPFFGTVARVYRILLGHTASSRIGCRLSHVVCREEIPQEYTSTGHRTPLHALLKVGCRRDMDINIHSFRENSMR